MAKLSTARSIGGIVLILIGFVFIISGISVMFFTTNMIFDFISIFFANVPTIVAMIGLFKIIFGVFLIWAGRMVRNEPFIPNFITRMMK